MTNSMTACIVAVDGTAFYVHATAFLDAIPRTSRLV